MTTTSSANSWSGSAEWSRQSTNDGQPNPLPHNPRKLLLEQCLAMIRYASMAGLTLPPDAVDMIERCRTESDETRSNGNQPPVLLSQLANAHRSLANVVKPATPSTIQLLADEKGRGWERYFGATRYARGLSYLSIVLFLALVALQVATALQGAQVGITWLEIVVTAVASLIGGIFYVMFALSRQLQTGAFDRKLEGQYTTLIILGGLAGTALSFLIVAVSTPGNEASSSLQVQLTRPLLALLGGFSARAVYRILERLVETVEALIRGSGNELVATQARELEARAAADSVSNRTIVIQELLTLARGMGNEQATAPARASIDATITKLVKDLPSSINPSESGDRNPDGS